jgi:acyl-coenzyme A thioesterase PaaI-like protein
MNADAEARIRQSFGRQTYMETMGAELVHVDEGEVDIALPFSEQLVRQDGFLHAGVVAGVPTAPAATPP